MSGDTEWRWADPDGQQRLVRIDELRAALANGLIPSNAPVWRDGWSEWQVAFEVPELTSSALSAANGVVPNIPPPPLFVVAAQTAFEGAPPPSARGKEPPAPPRYVPAPVVASRSLPGPPSGGSRAPHSSTRTSPISQRTSATEALKRAVPSGAKPQSARPPRLPTAPAAPSAYAPDTQPDVVAGPAARPAATGGKAGTVPTVHGVPRLADPRGSTNPPRPIGLDHTPLMPMAADRMRHDEPRSTLVFDGTVPSPSSRAPSVAPPIIAPGSGGAEKNAVTRPPPVDMGIMQVSPGSPRAKDDSSEEISGSMLLDPIEPRPLTSKPPPMPSKRPTPGLRALASGAPAARSRPPAPLMDGYKPIGDASSTTVHGIPPALPLRASKPAGPLPASAPPASSKARAMSPPTLMGVGPIPSPGPPPADLMAEVAAAERGNVPSLPPEETPPPPDARLVWMEPVLQRFPRLRPWQAGRPVFFLPVVGGLAALVVVIAVGLLVRGCLSLFSGDDKSARRKAHQPIALAQETEVSPAVGAGPAPVATDSTPAVESKPSCRPTGAGKTLAPKALVTGGVEAAAFGKTVAVGFAISSKEGVALELEPATLNVVATARARGTDLKRVTPVQVGGRLVAVADVEKRGDALVGRRTVGATNPFEIGLHAGQLAWSRGGTTTDLWSLDGEAPVEAARAASDGGGFALAFRRGTSVFVGLLNAQMKPSGSLIETRGFGPQVGSPTVGTSGGASLVMWADRPSAEQSWALRMRRVTSQGPEEPRPFTPSGGPGAPFIAPSVVGLEGGRFLVVWTEGPAKSHQVRGATLDAKGALEGAPFALSPPTANAGQAQAALGADGRGVVVYLVSPAGAREGFELAGVGISCAP